MNYLEGIPFRVTVSFVDDPVGDANSADQPQIELPKWAEVLTCTMHDFSLEKKVLYWIDSALRQEIPWFNRTSNMYPTAPPCWLLLVDSKENLASSHKATSCKTKEMIRVQSCMNLGTKFERLHCPGRREKTTEREDLGQRPEEQEGSEGKESSSTTSEEPDSEEHLAPMPDALLLPFDLPQSRPKTSPGHLTAASESACPRSLSGKPRQSTYFLDNVKNELEGAKKKLLAVMHPLNRTATDSALVSKAFSLHQHSRSSRNFRFGAGSPPRLAQTLIPTPPPPTSCCKPSRSAGLIGPIQHHKPTMASLSPYSCLPPPPGTQQPLSPHRAHPDSTTDLLSVLSQEERELIEPVVALGYPIRRAILALQKTGRQSLGQFLSYLSACDRLLKQGYEEAQVIEAMEMFQNSEKKALEFLRLLAQFNDMGFRQADIKEVLLLCENHRDRALEELMTQSQ
ncbi:ubiquitin-associated protein 1-like [Pseudonaja textilis]|uniref:ubiquitin-associated protein 1-like n=1 Tax=Pseudonaja textilis TaxID=8673 RepID=UPI000EA96379|nr:ubiquitin-associated protein 1-like [Pseudonaja textilis]